MGTACSAEGKRIALISLSGSGASADPSSRGACRKIPHRDTCTTSRRSTWTMSHTDTTIIRSCKKDDDAALIMLGASLNYHSVIPVHSTFVDCKASSVSLPPYLVKVPGA
jgi:hypothetical protein